MSAQPKAVALLSGGLDSMLAAKVVQDQGVHVEAINFFTGFCVEGHTHAIRQKDKDKAKRNNALWSAEQVGIKLHIVDISQEYVGVVTNPKHGYGQNLNPCLDCKGFMVAKAREWMEANGFDFIITGEVIGQRPKSQRRDTFPVVADESGAGDRLLRPLCAQQLEPTLPEREGWVDREGLYGFTGRSRKPQMQLAAQFGFEEYSQPAGGCCFLTDENFSRKLADLWNVRGKKEYDLDDIMLLKMGRHLRPAPNYKLIIAREDGENRFMNGYRKRFHAVRDLDFPGPLALVQGEPDDSDLQMAARITARYGKGRSADRVRAEITPPGGEPYVTEVAPMPPAQIPEEWHV
ncbi:tRNA (5-methylaminomethyl-2-thiouridylate)-methyltransferase [Thiohalorhabdus methylotrophus]|uniref:tRNA (5-methylaminomethyl-2-thiouridylate)-methyltransferase n=1 Tax=Thiohalorhabdus methylotrophus TaxID=3242694 RepID=A0ABV4TSU4_9GAMM